VEENADKPADHRGFYVVAAIVVVAVLAAIFYFAARDGTNVWDLFRSIDVGR